MEFKKYMKYAVIVILLYSILKVTGVYIYEEIITKEGSINEFETAVVEKTLEEVIVKENVKKIIYVIDGQRYSTQVIGGATYFLISQGLFEELRDSGVEVKTGTETDPIGYTFGLLYLALIVIIFIYILKMVMQFSKANLEYVKNEKTRFTDVGGYSYIKEELSDIIGYLKDPKGFSQYTDKMPKGILLEGDPGNGKTLFARVIAGESETPFFQISAADIEGSFVGQGASRIRAIFDEVRSKVKEHGKAILFIDELDSIGMSRENRTVAETTQTINKLLTELDGFKERENILIIGATNLVSSLDSALVRPGRFDRIIKVPMPNYEDRKEILNLYLGQKNPAVVHSEIYKLNYIDMLARQTEGFSGAALHRVINDAALLAYNKKEKIKIESLREAYLRVIAGLPNGIPISKEEERIVAYHEAAHAVVSMATSRLGVKSIAYGTIRSYGDALGHVALVSEGNRLAKKTDLYNRVKVLLAGRAIEDKILDGNYTTGASNDLKKVNELIYAYIIEYGMSPENENLFIDNRWGDIKADWILEEVKKIREKLYEETKELIDLYEVEVVKLAEYLMEHRDIDQDDLVKLFGEKFPEKGEDSYEKGN